MGSALGSSSSGELGMEGRASPPVPCDKQIRSSYIDAFERARPYGLRHSLLSAECFLELRHLGEVEVPNFHRRDNHVEGFFPTGAHGSSHGLDVR